MSRPVAAVKSHLQTHLGDPPIPRDWRLVLRTLQTAIVAAAAAGEDFETLTLDFGALKLKIARRMDALRETGDTIETLVPHSTWPLPTYREMLFIK